MLNVHSAMRDWDVPISTSIVVGLPCTRYGVPGGHGSMLDHNVVV